MSKHIPVPTPTPITQSQAMANFPKRPRDSHKGMFGTVAVIGGATGMAGAALLAARAALKMGAGCVHAGLLAENAPVADPAQPELMLHRAAELIRPRPSPHPRPEEAAYTRSMFKPDVFAIGCGMGKDIVAQRLLYSVLKTKAALVIDADALNLLAQHPDLKDDLRKRKPATVLTPHPGEAARLLGCGAKEIQENRVSAAQKLAEKFGCSVVLKGAGSLCVTHNGAIYINKTGNPGMSAAGMGDVLTGMIAAFIAQGMNAGDALLLAVHLHGAAGDALAGQKASIGMTASEVTEWARWLLNQWTTTS